MQSSQQTTASLCIQRDVSLIHNRGANLTPKSGSPFLPLLPFHSSSPLPSKDASVSECTWTLSALEALRNALYKFKTYLLTYLLTYSPPLPCPSCPLSSPFLSSLPFHPFPFSSPSMQLGVWGSAVSSPAANVFCGYFRPKKRVWW